MEDARWLVAPHAGIRPFLRLMAQAAQARGGRVLAEPEHGRFGFFIDAGGRAHPVHGAALGVNGDAAARLAADKDYAARVLAQAGLPVPEQRLVLAGGDGREGLAWARAQPGFGLWVKPNHGHGGDGVARVGDMAALEAAMAALHAAGHHVLLQRHVPGRELRVMVLEGGEVLTYERVGNSAGPGNLSQGGEARQVTPGAGIAALAVRAAQALGLRWAGVDLITTDPSGDAATVLEMNAAPGLDAYAAATPENWARAREVIGAALDVLGRG